MIAALIALVVTVAALAVSAATVAGRAWLAGERRERRLLELLDRQQKGQAEILDRFMYAVGKPWQDTADRPEPKPDPGWLGDAIVEDPVPGGGYAAGMFDDLDDDLFPGNNGDGRGERIDTGGLDPL